MRVNVHLTLGDLDDDDTIQGYRIKDLIVATEAAKKAGVTQEDLAGFLRNAESAFDFIRDEQDRVIQQAMHNIRWGTDL